MKWMFFMLCVFAIAYNSVAQSEASVGIGTTNPDTSAILDLNSTTKALLLPRIGAARLNSMTAKDGMLAYGSDSAALMVYGKAHLETMVSYMNPTQSGPGGNSWSPAIGFYYSQSYTPSSTFTLNKVNLACIANAGTTVSPASISIFDPGNTIIGTVPSPPIVTGVGTQKTVSADFSGSGILLKAGQTYRIAIRFSSVIPAGFAFRFYSTAVYSGGAFAGGGTLGFELTGRKTGWWPVVTATNLSSLLNGKIRMTGASDTISSAGNLVVQVDSDNTGNDSLVISKGSDTAARTLMRISSNGDAVIAGSVNTTAVTTSGAGTGASNMIPVAFGNIDGTATTPVIGRSSGNFSVVRVSQGRYNITFSASSPLANQDFNLLPVIVSVSGVLGATSSIGTAPGVLTVLTGMGYYGAPDDRLFSFMVYKP